MYHVYGASRVDLVSTIPDRSFHPVRIRRWINTLNAGASADSERFKKKYAQ